MLTCLLRLAAPNFGEAAARIAFISFDAVFIGWLGTEVLAGASLVFPIFLIMQLMSASGLGAGTASAIGRAIGAGRREDANLLAGHGFMLALAAGLIFGGGMLLAGPTPYLAMGATGESLDAAVTYSTILFAGVTLVWLMNTLANALRGAGNMLVPATAIIIGELAHLLLSPVLILGLGPFPALGIVGAAIGILASYLLGSLILIAYMVSGRSDIRLGLRTFAPAGKYFGAILGVGALSSIGVLLLQVIVVTSTALAAGFGSATLAAFGAASRLELLQFPLTFAVGTAVITMVATNIGADAIHRVWRIAWIGTALCTGIGTVFAVVAVFMARPWMSLFSHDEAVLGAGVVYLNVIGLTLPFVGAALGLVYAMLGAGKARPPLLAAVLRLAIVAGLGWAGVELWQGDFFNLVLVFAAGLGIFAGAIFIAGYRVLDKIHRRDRRHGERH